MINSGLIVGSPLYKNAKFVKNRAVRDTLKITFNLSTYETLIIIDGNFRLILAQQSYLVSNVFKNCKNSNFSNLL